MGKTTVFHKKERRLREKSDREKKFLKHIKLSSQQFYIKEAIYSTQYYFIACGGLNTIVKKGVRAFT